MTTLHLLVRAVHVLGMALLVGGSAVTWNALRIGGAAALPTQYEWLFWPTMGAMLATGVGNLGALGAPGPDTRWGALLTAKLLVVLALVVGSALRTLVVVRLRERQGTAAVGPLQPLYGATTLGLLAVLGLAEVLAHG